MAPKGALTARTSASSLPSDTGLDEVAAQAVVFNFSYNQLVKEERPVVGKNPILGGGGVHHINVRAHNPDESALFYEKNLGMKVAYAWGEGTTRQLLLDTGDGSFLELVAWKKDPVAVAGVLAHIALRTTRLDPLVSDLRREGIEITKEPMDIVVPGDSSMNARIAFFKGPDGESIELFQVGEASI